MGNLLQELVNTYSFRTLLKSNIMSMPGAYSGVSQNMTMLAGGRNSSPSNGLVSNKYMSTYYLKMQEIMDYEVTELTNTVVSILKDYLTNYFILEGNVITLPPELKSAEDKINKIFAQLDYANDVKTHISDIIYHGSYSYKVIWNSSSARYEKVPLANPHNVIAVHKKGKVNSHLVVSRQGKIVEVTPHSIVTIGSNDLHLINDINPDYDMFSDDDTLVKETEFTAGTPLYYNICNKVKEYILKDQIVSLLSIKDLIQPLLLLIRVDKNTSPDIANQLASNTENLINKYSDISSILTANFTIADLMDSLINNIRVLPDYQSAMGDMNTVDLSKITNKIQEIRGEQDSNREQLLNSIGIPLDLFAGRATRWEALKTSERLNSKINSYIKNIEDSTKYQACVFYYLLTGSWITPSKVTCNLFTKTAVEYNSAIASAEIINNLIRSIGDILEASQRLVIDSRFIDSEEFYDYVGTQLKVIDPDIEKFLKKDELLALIKEIKKKRDAEASGESTEGGMWTGSKKSKKKKNQWTTYGKS